MRRDADIQVQRISRAIEKVLRSDGWINGLKIYDGRHLRKIAESMARKCSDPSRFVNQGFHNTSVTQCILRQLLETNPALVMEMIASLVTSGKASIGQGKHGRLVVPDAKSLALDLESRWANDDTSSANGVRDPVGQLFDILLTQAHWDEKSDDNLRYVYTQDPKPRPGTTGERLVKVDKSGNRIEVAYEGPRLTVMDVFNIARMFDETPNCVIAHASVVGDLKEPSITDAEELSNAISSYKKASGKPPALLVFAGLLPGGSGVSRGYDLHACTALSIEDTYFLESRWGLTSDMHLNGLTAEELIRAMKVPDEVPDNQEETYNDSSPVFMRVVDPSYPIPRFARAPQFLTMQKEREQISDFEKQALSNPNIQAQEKYFEELEKWEAKRAEHQAIFGDDLPFTVPAPAPPT